MKMCQAQPQMILSLVSFPRKQTLKWRFAFRSLSGASLASNTSAGERAAGWDEGYDASPEGAVVEMSRAEARGPAGPHYPWAGCGCPQEGGVTRCGSSFSPGNLGGDAQWGGSPTPSSQGSKFLLPEGHLGGALQRPFQPTP